MESLSLSLYWLRYSLIIIKLFCLVIRASFCISASLIDGQVVFIQAMLMHPNNRSGINQFMQRSVASLGNLYQRVYRPNYPKRKGLENEANSQLPLHRNHWGIARPDGPNCLINISILSPARDIVPSAPDIIRNPGH